ncbi:MAG: D-sedoheptulose-7-phosphate isomerase [Pontibacterium sp.]
MSFTAALERHNATFLLLPQLEPQVTQLIEDIYTCLQQGGKVLWMGNGGSAADCQHLAAEFVVRYKAERGPLASIALTVDTSIITAHTNDYEFESLFARQIQALAKPEDLVIGLTTSGNSGNVIQGIEAAKAIGAKCWAWTGRSGGKLASDTSVALIKVPSAETARIQEAHIFIGHWICEALDAKTTNSTKA